MTHEEVNKLHKETKTLIKNYKKSLQIRALMVDKTRYAVESQNNPGTAYIVTFDGENGYWACECEGFNYRAICTHVLSVMETSGELNYEK